MCCCSSRKLTEGRLLEMFQSQHAILMNKSWLHREGQGGGAACAPEIVISLPVNHLGNDTEKQNVLGPSRSLQGVLPPSTLKPPINEQLMTALPKEVDSIYNNICRQLTQ